MCSIDSDWPLHYCSFHGLYGSLKEVLERNADVNKRDMYGMTALHIAVMLGHKDCAEMLLSHGACVTLKSLEGWNSLSEAISYGSLSLTTSLYCKLRRQFLDPEKIDEFQTTLSFIPDCQLTFDWEFISWMPFISKLLPSDTCCLRKIGQCLRLDTSVMDMNGLQWKRGDLSIVFNPKNRPALMLFNHKKRTYRSIGEKANLLNDVEVLRNTELLSMRLVADKMTWAPLTNRGIRRNRHRTEEKIGIFNVKHYIISNVIFRTVKRTEHLPESGRWIHRARRKSSVDSPRPSGTNREKSLSPPDGHKQPLGPGECNPANINWDQYKSGKLKPTQTYLGRKPEIKRTEKRLKLNITMTEEIPLTIPQLLDMLRVLSPMSKFEKLRDLLKSGLPPGFPLRLEMPIFPTTIARVEVKNIQLFTETLAKSDLQSPASDDIICSSTQASTSLDRHKWFAIPEGYTFSGEFRLSKATKSS